MNIPDEMNRQMLAQVEMEASRKRAEAKASRLTNAAQEALKSLRRGTHAYLILEHALADD